MKEQKMDELSKLVRKQYGEQLRIRVCGVCIENDKVLLINHLGILKNNDFWSVPGGGLSFGETIEECLKREFLEETNTQIEVGEFLTVREFIELPLHAIELFYEVSITGGKLQKGTDPEMVQQIIQAVRWMNLEEIKVKSKVIFHPVVWDIAKKFNKKAKN